MFVTILLANGKGKHRGETPMSGEVYNFWMTCEVPKLQWASVEENNLSLAETRAQQWVVWVQLQEKSAYIKNAQDSYQTFRSET